jgi:acetyl esterase/lipase
MRLTQLSILICLCTGAAGFCRAAQGVDNTPAPEFARQREVIYGHKHGMALTLDVLTPKNAKEIGVLWVISSSGRSSVERIDSPSCQRCFRILLGRGYTIFAVVHSSAPRFTLQDMVPDVRRAVRFVRYRASDFRVDANRLGIAGASAGGTLALLMGTTGMAGDPNNPDPVERMSSNVQAVGCFFGPSDWLDFDGQGTDVLTFQKTKYGSVDPSFAFYEIDPDRQICSEITDEQKIHSLLREYSPARHVTQDDAPTLIIHGDADPFIPIQQSKGIIHKFQENNVPCQLVIRSGKGHGWDGWENDTTLIADWFDKHLCQKQ